MRHATGTAKLDSLLVWLMWSAMALAMMLPTAGPMILTYADIAATAARQKGEPVVSPAVLAAGYVTVWLGFAVCGDRPAMGSSPVSPYANPGIATAAAGSFLPGAVFLAAGALPVLPAQACLCVGVPAAVPVLLRQLDERAERRVRARVASRAYCLGCCWAMMLLMLAAAR